MAKGTGCCRCARLPLLPQAGAGVVALVALVVVHSRFVAGLRNNPVQVFRTLRGFDWEFLRLRTGFGLSSSWNALPCYGRNRNRNILDFMK
jgi:hypothetical protein